MASRYNPLSEREQEAYGLLVKLMSGLNETEQHNVLKEAALRQGRELNPLGALRSAAIAGSIRAATKIASKAGSNRAGSNAHGGSQEAYKAWLKKEGKALWNAREAVVMDNPPSADQIARRKAASDDLRTAWQSFRTGQGASRPEQKESSGLFSDEA